MPGSLNDILPDPISQENEEILLDLIVRKMRGAAGLAVLLLHAMEERFGPEAREVVRELARNREVPPNPDAGDPEADLRAFCDRLDRGCVGSHRWEKVIDDPDCIGYQFHYVHNFKSGIAQVSRIFHLQRMIPFRTGYHYPPGSSGRYLFQILFCQSKETINIPTVQQIMAATAFIGQQGRNNTHTVQQGQ